MDIGKALVLLGGDREIFDEVLATFLANLPQAAERLQAAVREGDARQLQAAAHGLKGGASAIMAEPIRSIAERLEELGRKGGVEGAVAELETLEVEINRLQEAAASVGNQGAER